MVLPTLVRNSSLSGSEEWNPFGKKLSGMVQLLLSTPGCSTISLAVYTAVCMATELCKLRLRVQGCDLVENVSAVSVSSLLLNNT